MDYAYGFQMEIEEESTQMGEKNEAGVRIVIEKGAQDTLWGKERRVWELELVEWCDPTDRE